MRSFVAMAAFGLAVAISAATSQAATLNFTGNMITGTDTPPFLANGTFNLLATYNESPTLTEDDATASTLSFQKNGGGTLDYFKPGARQVSIIFGKSGTNDTLRIVGDYRPVPTGELAKLDILFTRAQTSGSTLLLNSTNVALMLSNPTTYTGTFFQYDAGDNIASRAILGGTIPVPEPGSIGLLAGLGMFCGRRIYRRRQQKKAEAAV
ncbi:MAG: PEP-CTERM sorting domain-containing protein [Planctomycetaceae bacterium]